MVKEGEVIPVLEPEEPEEEEPGEVKPEEPTEDDTTKPVPDDDKEEVKPPVEDEEENADTNKPQTGDNSNMTLWISLLVISGISFVAIAKCNIKRRVSKHSK